MDDSTAAGRPTGAAALATWILELAGRWERGELRSRGPLELEPGVTIDDLDRAVGIMLRQAGRLSRLPAEQRSRPRLLAERRALARRLLLLHDRLNGRPLATELRERPRAF